MELLFRKYFWAVNLAFLLLAGLLAARTVNVFTADALRPTPDFSPAPSERQTRYAPAARVSAETFSKVTGIKLPDPEPLVKEPVARADDLSSEPIHTTLHAKLIGTTVANVKEWSWSVIEDTQSHTNDSYMVGDRIQGAQVLDILEDRVIVNNGGHREYIDMNEGTAATVAALAPAAPMIASDEPPPPSTALGQSIRPTGENEYEVPRAEVERTLSNLNDIAMQARIVPAFKNGVATGFKLFSIRPDSIYARIGIQNGDVIRRINGFEINSPDKALEAYSKLREASRIEIEVERNGSVVRKTYNVR